MNILIVYPHNPFLNNSGVNNRFLALLNYFKEKKIIVDVLSHKNFIDGWGTYDNSLIDNLYLNDFNENNALSLRLKRKIKNLLGNSFVSYVHPKLIKQFQKIVKNNSYDYILISYVQWADLLKHIDTSKMQTILTVEDFISLNSYERYEGYFNLGKSINEEIDRVNLFDKVIFISEEEMNFFKRVSTCMRFYYIPHFLDSKFSNKIKDTDIVFLGSDNPFNKNGMIWFLEKVMPHLGDVYKIKIIGQVNQHLGKYKSRFQNIEFINYVESLDDIYSRSRISICPLHGGTGLKIKVVESLSYGVPLVSTSCGISGLDSKFNGCIVQDVPKEFAKSIKNMLEVKHVYQKYAGEAKGYFLDNFSKDSVYKRLDKVFFE